MTRVQAFQLLPTSRYLRCGVCPDWGILRLKGFGWAWLKSLIIWSVRLVSPGSIARFRMRRGGRPATAGRSAAVPSSSGSLSGQAAGASCSGASPPVGTAVFEFLCRDTRGWSRPGAGNGIGRDVSQAGGSARNRPSRRLLQVEAATGCRCVDHSAGSWVTEPLLLENATACPAGGTPILAQCSTPWATHVPAFAAP